MRAKVGRGIAVAVAIAVMTGGAASPQEPALIRMAGPAAIARQLAPELVAGYASGTGRLVTPQIAAGTSEAGLAALAAGRTDIAMLLRRVTDDERVLVLRAGLGDPAAEGDGGVVALEGLAVLINRDNAIGILTLDQIRRLFSGQIRNWSALGGRDLPVTIYGREGASEAGEAFEALALGGDKMAKATVVSATGQSLAEAVAADPGGIGFARIGETGAAKPVTIALACGITVEPKPFYARTEEYPLVRRLYFYTAANKPPLVQDFLRFSLSDAAQPIVRRAGLIDLAPELGSAGEGLPRPGMWEPAEARRRGEILSHINQSLSGARRLSTTFRFEADGVTLDPRAVDDVARVAAWKRANRGRKLILVGYSSGAGPFETNLVASGKQAQTAASALAAAGAAPDLVLTGSTLRPVACDDDATGGPSRRVEVWAR